MLILTGSFQDSVINGGELRMLVLVRVRFLWHVWGTVAIGGAARAVRFRVLGV